MAKWKINRLEEKLKNTDYPKFLKLFNSEDPKYYFVCMSACRGVSDEEEPSQKMIDDINHRNNKASEDLMNQLIANGMHYLNYTRFREPGYIEKFEKKFKEDYYKDLR